MTRLSYLLLGLVLLAVTSCKNRNQVPETASIEFSRTACFGTCPIYKMTILGSGLATFEGERFTEKLGSFSIQLSEKDTKALFQQLDTFDWAGFKDIYPTEVSDLPGVVFQFNYKQTSKKVVVRGEHPNTLDVLQSVLSTIAESDGWTSTTTE